MNNERMRELLIKHEGLRLKPYRDTVGKLTIGVGRNLDDVGISSSEAFYLLDNDVQKVLSCAKSQFAWFDGLSENRQMVIISMIFNMGLLKFLGFHNTISMIEAGDYEGAAKGMLDSLWAKQVSNRAVELSEMMKRG